jgi:hypothetical protein
VPDSNLADIGVLTSSFYNTYIREQVIVTCTSATRPTGVEGRRIYETDTDLEYVHNGTSWILVGGVDGWTSFTPQIDQGVTNIAKTVTYSKWMRGPRRTITFSFSLALTAGGTGGSAVSITLPVAAASATSVQGAGSVYDASTATRYVVQLKAPSTTTISFYPSQASPNPWGIAPSLALASADDLSGSVTYEAAS